jgi:hypothetical protein
MTLCSDGILNRCPADAADAEPRSARSTRAEVATGHKHLGRIHFHAHDTLFRHNKRPS